MSTPTVDIGFTVDDLDAMPDNGRRYELIGGAIVVTPSPGPPHQRASRRLERLIERACPPGYEMFDAPVDLDLPSGDRVVPDIVVVPDSSVGELRLVTPVLLVVEFVSPGSRTNDYITKRAAYAAAAISYYWIIDTIRGHTLALRLVGEAYETYVDATGPVNLHEPINVRFDPAALAARPVR